jgi:hypothetical protein
VERGGAKVQPLDLANMGTWEGNLQQRTAILTEQSQRTGADPKALFPQEVQAFKSALDGAKVEQKRDILATLRKGLGDEKVYRATLQQIAPDDPVTQAAGIAAARGLTDNTGKVQIAKDAAADDKFLGGLNFYVKGVEGKIPGGK